MKRGVTHLLCLVLGTAPLFATFLVAPIASAQTCLDYKTVGMSDCQSKKKLVVEPEIIGPLLEETPPPESEQAPPPVEEVKVQTLDEKVDDFIKNYEKPPREFVTFNLEPTLDNALKWVQKYNEMLERTRQLSIAWSQAQKIYTEAKRTGKEVPALDNPMPPVPDYGVSVDPTLDQLIGALGMGGMGDMGGAAGPMAMGQPAPVEGGGDMAALMGGGAMGGGSKVKGVDPSALNALLGGMPDGAVSTGSMPLENGQVVMEDTGTIRVSYYFSAECPYCHEFEPEFQKVIDDLGDRLDVTCIDMTPSGQKRENIFGKVDCSWRPIMANEMETYGVQSTPTLLISRAGGGPMERVTGFVDAPTLKTHLLKGQE